MVDTCTTDVTSSMICLYFQSDWVKANGWKVMCCFDKTHIYRERWLIMTLKPHEKRESTTNHRSLIFYKTHTHRSPTFPILIRGWAQDKTIIPLLNPAFSVLFYAYIRISRNYQLQEITNVNSNSTSNVHCNCIDLQMIAGKMIFYLSCLQEADKYLN